MQRLIKAAVDRGATVLHIRAGDVFRARIDGRILKLSSQVFTPEETRRIALQMLPAGRDPERIDEIPDFDTSWDVAGVGRFRVHVLRQRGSFVIVMRVIPRRVPTLDELNLPPVLGEIAGLDHGLVVVTGSVGAGKSTAQAAMVGWINERMQRHVVTLEAPIEFLHADEASVVTQREVGVDTDSFAAGVRAALRQDADVILIGEARDRETIDATLRAAELGRLVITTMHAPTALGALMRLFAVFPREERDVGRLLVAESLRAVVALKLLPRKDGAGPVPAVEVLRVTGAVRDCILTGRPLEEIHLLMRQGEASYGMRTFQQDLERLVEMDFVDYETARAAAPSPADFELVMQTLADDSRSRLGEIPGEAP
ncbi:MAG: PilT/PilU family type 4a pilus ATPase [Gemmatimonadota bacterium]|nr:PilT/PilU family type 4a pilus ATPase [Gemmatimonadota bacterium]